MLNCTKQNLKETFTMKSNLRFLVFRTNQLKLTIASSLFDCFIIVQFR